LRLFDVIAILVTLTALLSYFNHRYIRLHPSIGVMLISLLLSFALIALGAMGFGVRAAAVEFMSRIHFGDALLTWMLGFLLFAGALTVDLNELRRRWGVTAALATFGTAASMFIVAGLIWLVLRPLGLPLPWAWCLLFGALISPTDPVAVVAVMKQAGAAPAVETIVSSESLFNDGVGVVLFLAVLHSIQTSAVVTFAGITEALVKQTLGGAALGFLTGLIIYRMLRRTHNFQVEVLLTLALAMGTYSLASSLGMSGPIAVVVAGLLIGNQGRILPMAEAESVQLEKFWELLDEVLNAVLFVLIGVEVLVMHFTPRHLLAALAAIPIVLLARAATVLTIRAFIPPRRRIGHGTAAILIWGGLRGGLAIAMAISVPQSPARDLIIAITYGVVCFSILVQGTTIRGLVNRTISHPGGWAI
jgi:CPA1 family monovalent cation:H+ antiporter